MSLFSSVFRRKKPAQVFDPNPAEVYEMPTRPYRVLYADLPFYYDSKCERKVPGASLIVLESEDPTQNHKTIECMPVRKRYAQGQWVTWNLNNKMLWEAAWYRSPDTGEIEQAWAQSVEFSGKVVRLQEEGRR